MLNKMFKIKMILEKIHDKAHTKVHCSDESIRECWMKTQKNVQDFEGRTFQGTK